MQGYNARKVISEVCAFFVLQCVLSLGGNLMLLTSSDTKGTLMHLFLFTNSTQRELVSICTYATAIKFPCISTLAQCTSRD